MGCLVIDENILISIDHYNKELNGKAIDDFNLLFDIVGFELYAYKCKASESFRSLCYIEDDSEFAKVSLTLLKHLVNRYRIYSLFKNDKDWKRDLLLLTYAYWRAKERNEKCVLLTREKRIKEACKLMGLECCCLLHVLDCVVNGFGFDEFNGLLTHLKNHTSLTHPNWAYQHSIHCDFFKS